MTITTTFVSLSTTNSGNFLPSRKFKLCRPRSPPPVLRRRRNAITTLCVDPTTEEAQKQQLEQQKSLEEELKKLEGTKLKWADIDFPTIEDELNAIDEYVREEEIRENDCWPVFLRACAYESRGQTQLAIAQLSKIKTAAGLSMVPNLWERRAYNTFKAGDVEKANALFNVSIRILTEAVGNGLHFAHWFDENFANFLPRHNGPSFAVQRGITKFCCGMLDEARGGLVPALIVRDLGSEHAILWLIAATIRTGKEESIKADFDIIEEFCSSDLPKDLNGTLRQCIDLYYKCARNSDGVFEAEVESLKKISEKGNEVDSLIAKIYLALYYDSVRRDESLRDEWLDKVCELSKGISTTDTLDFVYHAAKSRFGLKTAKVDDGDN